MDFLLEYGADGMLLAVMCWLWLDNRSSHSDIYGKLHDDHDQLSARLMDIYEKLGGKSEK